MALKFQWRNFLSENQAALLYLNSRGFTNDTAFICALRNYLGKYASTERASHAEVIGQN